MKLAAAEGLLQDDTVWLAMLKDRSDDSHMHCKADAVVYISRIAGRCLPEMELLIGHLKELIPEEPWEDARIPDRLPLHLKITSRFIKLRTPSVRNMGAGQMQKFIKNGKIISSYCEYAAVRSRTLHLRAGFRN